MRTSYRFQGCFYETGWRDYCAALIIAHAPADMLPMLLKLSLMPNGNVRYQLNTPYRDGTTHVIFGPLDFIARLAVLEQKPRIKLTRFHSVFAPNSKHREPVAGVVAERPLGSLLGIARALDALDCNVLVTAVRPYTTAGRSEAPATVPSNFRNAHMAAVDQAPGGRRRKAGSGGSHHRGERPLRRKQALICAVQYTEADAPPPIRWRPVTGRSVTNGHSPAGQSRRPDG